MRTVTINLFSFDELSESAKQKALNHFRENNYYSDFSDMVNTIEKIAEKCNFHCEWLNNNEIDYYIEDYYWEEIENLKGKRAFAYVMNNYISPNMINKTYRLKNNYYSKSRKSKLFKTINDCCFTGYAVDCCFFEAFKEWKNKFNNNTTVGEFIILLSKKLNKEWEAEIDYVNSDEFIEEVMTYNGYEFLEDGTLY